MKYFISILTAVLVFAILSNARKQNQKSEMQTKMSEQISTTKTEPVKEIYFFIPENEEKLMYAECKKILNSNQNRVNQSREIINLVEENAGWYAHLKLTDEETNQARAAASRGMTTAKEKFQNWDK